MSPEELEKLISAIKSQVKSEMRRSLSVWMTESEAATYLKISPDTLARMRGKLRPARLGKRWRYRRESLDQALTNHWL